MHAYMKCDGTWMVCSANDENGNNRILIVVRRVHTEYYIVEWFAVERRTATDKFWRSARVCRCRVVYATIVNLHMH